MLFKRKPHPKAQLRYCNDTGFGWWSVWIWQKDFFGGYWKYVKGTTNENFARNLYESCVKHGDCKQVVIEQS